MIRYYLTFTDYQGNTFTSDGSPLYQVTDVNFSSLQTLNIGSQSSGAGAGKVTFNPLTFTLASDKLTERLDQDLASGTPFAQVNLVGYETDAHGQPVQVSRDVFKLAAVKSDSIDASDGLHTFSMEYGGLVESVTPLTSTGTPGTTVTAGWNAVQNTADHSLTSNIGAGGGTTLPPLNPTNAVAPPDASKTDDLFVRFIGYNGGVIAGGDWIKVDSANLSFLQTLNIGSQSTGAGAGKVTFNPLSLTFAPGSLEPTLLQMEASGTPIKQMDVAAYSPTGGSTVGALVEDYRFGLAAIKSNDDSVSNGVSTDNYTFEYGDEQIATFAPGSSTPTIQGWNRVSNLTNTNYSLGTVPTTEAGVQTQLAALGAVATNQTKYYLTFTDYQGHTFTSDGSALYQVTDVDFSSLQTLNIGSQSTGAGAGKVTFNPLTFTLASDKLTERLDQDLASGTPFAQVNLVGYDTGPHGQPVQVLRDIFKLAAVKSDSIDASNGLHALSMEYGGLVESVTPLTTAGTLGTTVTTGWNRVQNIADHSLTSTIGAGGGTTLPPLNPTNAVAPPDASKTDDLFVRFIGYNGAVIAGGNWIKVDSANLSFLQTLNIGSQSSGAGAGKVTFNPLSLTFAPGSLEPTLLQMEAAGVAVKQLDVAAYSPTGGALAEDYRFGLAAIKSNDDSVSNGVPTDNYTFEYGDEQIATFAPGSSTPTIQGWNRATNQSDTNYSLGTVPTTEASVQTQLAAVGTTATDQTKFYLTFTDPQNHTFASDGSPLYQVTDVNFSTLQTLNIGSQSSGAGAGKVTFNPLTFTLASDKLTERLDQDLASGTPFAQVNLVGYDTDASGQSVQVLRDVFKLAAVKSDSIDAANGLHNLSMEYGGLVESTTPITTVGAPGTTVTKGWNRVQNTADPSLTSNLGAGGGTTLPPLDPTNAVAPPDASKDDDLFVHFIGYNGAVIAGGKWIKVDSANLSFLQTLNIGSQSTGAGAGKVTFNPLSLTFAPGSLEPTLLQMEASGTAIKQMDVAAFSPTGGSTLGALVEDYRFGLAAIKSDDDSVSNGVPTDTYTFEYGNEQIGAFTPGSSTPTVQGWNRVSNISDTNYSLGALPTTEAQLLTELACYCAGVRLLTDRGEVAVEALAVGDLAVTASGALRPIVWIGHRTIDISRHPDPAAVWPVRVLAGAFGEGLPRRDLWLSPGHNVAFEGALMPISSLINGRSVVQIEQGRVEYWHVELDAHDIVLAEGLPAESYLDCGNRTAFVNGGAFVEAHPDFQPKRPADTCLPLVKEGPPVVTTKARLLARLAERGLCVDREADAHIVVDGLRVEPVRVSETRLAFLAPAGGREISLRSNVFVPAHVVAASADTRELGLCIGGLRIDGATLALDSNEACATGWRDPEFSDGRFTHRWTSGATSLPAGARNVIVDLAGVGYYWRRREEGPLAQFG